MALLCSSVKAAREKCRSQPKKREFLKSKTYSEDCCVWETWFPSKSQHSGFHSLGLVCVALHATELKRSMADYEQEAGKKQHPSTPCRPGAGITDS